MNVVFLILKILAILVLAPLVGGLLTGADRVISAKMQRRKGPPLLQPFYDVAKLMAKQSTTVNRITRFFITFTLCFTALTVVLFLLGMDILLCIFAFTLACLFFIIAGYSSYSPYSFIGTERELIQIMCYEPMILITAFGMYKVAGTFSIAEIVSGPSPLIWKLPLVFLGLCFVLTVKLRKSPFDLSMSHHGHQEIVKGVTTELTGICLAMLEVVHWLETIFALGYVYIFFAHGTAISHVIAAGMCLVVYFAEILVDNAFARVRWSYALSSCWVVTLVLGGVNLLALTVLG